MRKKTVRKKKEKEVLYVACVVAVPQVLNNVPSGRPQGDWASFISPDLAVCVKKAMKARAEWELKRFGPYSIFIGTLDGEIKSPTRYKIVPRVRARVRGR